MHLWSSAVAITLLSGAMSQPPPTPFRDTAIANFVLSLAREYGRAVFSQCRLDVAVYEGAGRASLFCVSPGSDGKGRPVPPLTSSQELTRADAQQLTVLVQRSRLFDGEYAGSDMTPSDGIFETLKVRAGATTAVVVTSGNPSFTSQSSRRELLALLTSLERVLLERARTESHDDSTRKRIRNLGRLSQAQMAIVERATAVWLGLSLATS
jgi:hypothetical protein